METKKDIITLPTPLTATQRAGLVLEVFKTYYSVSYAQLCTRFEDRGKILAALDYLLLRHLIAIADDRLNSFVLPSDYQNTVFVITPKGSYFDVDNDSVNPDWDKHICQ